MVSYQSLLSKEYGVDSNRVDGAFPPVRRCLQPCLDLREMLVCRRISIDTRSPTWTSFFEWLYTYLEVGLLTPRVLNDSFENMEPWSHHAVHLFSWSDMFLQPTNRSKHTRYLGLICTEKSEDHSVFCTTLLNAQRSPGKLSPVELPQMHLILDRDTIDNLHHPLNTLSRLNSS